MRPALAAFMALLCAGSLEAETAPPPTSVEVTIEPQKFGDVSSILKVDSTVASFRFDQPVRYLALVLEAYPKEAQSVPLARLALDLTKPMKEGRLCVQMADQGFLPVGNGAPHQMQLFMQLDCGGTLISSSQSFLKEKFNCNKSLARMGAGTDTRNLAGNRAPVFWLMGNSDKGTYLNDDDLDKMIAKNCREAYVLIAYLEVSKDAGVLAQQNGASVKGGTAAGTPPSSPATNPLIAAVPAVDTTPPALAPQEQVKPAVPIVAKDSDKEDGSKSAKSSSSSSSSTKKKKRRS